MGERKMFSNRIDEDIVKELKHLAIDENKPLGILLEEAIRDLLKKYDKKPIKPKTK
jgi:predicted transcriptional regulator